VVASNKRGNAGTQSLYDRLHAAAAARGTGFLYETNVGAGLPVLKTINDLITGGDRILRIEGVFSGTLSYLFNAYTAGTRFSDIVREAREKGYTEPDPREDLNGMDVGRKLLILAREAGSRLELRNIRIESLISPPLRRTGSVAGFMRQLHRMDDAFESRRERAARRGRKLRYLASYAGGGASVGLREVGPDHPAFALGGSEVAIVLTTAFCRERPVIIRGPGAGADVTAAGVLADIIHLAREH
jgi:aspartokinase/homoserine dehydrogenase 1